VGEARIRGQSSEEDKPTPSPLDETCEACGKTITRRAIAHLVDGQVVCTGCEKALRKRKSPPPLSVPKPPPLPFRTFYSKVAGTSQINANGIHRQAVVAACAAGERLFLVREPKNPVSRHAIMVLRLDGAQLGYLPDHTAEELSEEMDAGVAAWAQVKELTGGTAEKPTLGMNLVVFVWER
jgi:hypothetical protein